MGEFVLRFGKAGFLVGGEGGSGAVGTHFLKGDIWLVAIGVTTVRKRVWGLGLMGVGASVVYVIHVCEVEKRACWLPSVAVVCCSSWQLVVIFVQSFCRDVLWWRVVGFVQGACAVGVICSIWPLVVLFAACAW